MQYAHDAADTPTPAAADLRAAVIFAGIEYREAV
jgi:hypothetical protein